MKKTLSVLILVGLLMVLVVPMMASAQTEPAKCCKLGKDIKWTSGKVNDVVCTPASPCSLTKGNDVGPSDATCPDAAAPEHKTDQWGFICLINGLYVATDWIFIILIVVVGLFIIWGAFDIVTAAGTPEKVGSGRNKILYALIGLAVALLAKALPSIVSALLGV